jgi:hypothetical protein
MPALIKGGASHNENCRIDEEREEKSKSRIDRAEKDAFTLNGGFNLNGPFPSRDKDIFGFAVG